MKIYNALGVYAFPDGKPALDWGSTVINHLINVNGVTGGLTFSDVEIDGTSESSLPSQIADSKSLSLKLNLPSDMYVFDDGVTITMGGVNITNETGVWDESTGEIYIDEVMGDVVIVANAITYVQDHLVLHLDGKTANRGGIANHWKSLVDYGNSKIDFTLTNCDETADDHVYFNGSDAKGIADVSLLDLAAADCSIEAAYTANELNSQAFIIMHNGIGSGLRLCLSTGHSTIYSDGENHVTMCNAANGLTIPGGVSFLMAQTDFLATHYLSMVKSAFLVDGEAETSAGTGSQAANANSVLSLFYRVTSNEMFFKGSLYALRVYSDKLTPAEQLQNYKVDKKRFNL